MAISMVVKQNLLRFSANYVDVLEVEGGTYDNQEPSAFQVRSQWAF
jgi:phosphate-selective porin OprO/OprP